jgi:hypothetical protein
VCVPLHSDACLHAPAPPPAGCFHCQQVSHVPLREEGVGECAHRDTDRECRQKRGLAETGRGRKFFFGLDRSDYTASWINATPPRGRRPHCTCGKQERGGERECEGCCRRSMGLSSGGILIVRMRINCQLRSLWGAQAEHQPSGVDLTRPGSGPRRLTKNQYQKPKPQGGRGGRPPPEGWAGQHVDHPA